MSKPIFGYWGTIRGFGNQHRLLLKYLNVDFEYKEYDFGTAPDFKKEGWLAEKPNLGLDFPNVPYWIDDKIKLTESKAILKYIARSRGPALVPETIELQAVADMVEGLVNDLQRALVNLAYYIGVAEIPLQESQSEKFEKLEEFFSNRQWTVGDNISYIDFFVYEVLKQYTKFNGDFLKPYPSLANYVEKFDALPELADYIKSIDHLICYSPWALLQF